MSEYLSPEVMAEEAKKEAINKVLPLKMGAIPKAELVLIILGMKPATTISLAPWNSPPEEFEEALHAAGLMFIKGGVNKKDFRHYAVAQTQETVEKLSGLHGSVDRAQFGALMGFPPTAIEGFVNNTRAPREEIPKDPANVFDNFVLSKDHWQEEREVQLGWSRAIMQYAPDVYKQLRGRGHV